MKLPADEKVLEAIDNTALSYTDTFPLGQPFKSLYAIHALHEHFGCWRPSDAALVVDEQAHSSLHAASLVRALSLVVMAISDPQVIAQCPTQELQIELGSALVQLFVSLLRGIWPPQPQLCVSLVLMQDVQIRHFQHQQPRLSMPPCWIVF